MVVAREEIRVRGSIRDGRSGAARIVAGAAMLTPAEPEGSAATEQAHQARATTSPPRLVARLLSSRGAAGQAARGCFVVWSLDFGRSVALNGSSLPLGERGLAYPKTEGARS